MLVRDVMTRDPHTIHADQTLQAVHTMCEWGRFRHVPVVDRDGRLVGVVSTTDVLRAAPSECDPATPLAERDLQLSRTSVAQVMSAEPVSVDPRTRVADAATAMLLHRVNCLPVLEGERLVGIVTALDLLALVVRDETPTT